VAVWGLGGVGLAALLGAVAAGAEPVIAIDPVPEKRALALELGARAAVAPEDAAQAFAKHGAPRVAIESVGSGKVLAEAYRTAARGGRIVTVGLPNPADPFTIPAVSLVAEAKTIIGSYMGSAVPARDIPRYIALWRAGRLPVERLLSGVRPMAEINDALDALASGHAIRQILIP
jgi:alcohol dehydrogenase